MTCIAYKDGVLASDSYFFHQSIAKNAEKIKLVANEDGNRFAIAIEGDAAFFSMFEDWLATGGDYPEYNVTDFASNVIVMNQHGAVFIYNNMCEGNPIEMDTSEPMAWGDGYSFAFGAMMAGKSAPEAVKIACKNTETCGGDVWFVDSNKKLQLWKSPQVLYWGKAVKHG